MKGTEKKLALSEDRNSKRKLMCARAAEAASGLSCRATAALAGADELSKDSFLFLQRTDGKAPARANRSPLFKGELRVCACVHQGRGPFACAGVSGKGLIFLSTEAKVPRNTNSHFLFPFHTLTLFIILFTLWRKRSWGIAGS